MNSMSILMIVVSSEFETSSLHKFIFIRFIISVLYLNYYLNTTQSRRKRNENDGVFDDISLNNKPQLQFSCKYNRDVYLNSELTIASTSTQSEQEVSHTGILEYEATVKDVKIGRDSFTEVLIKPKHHLSNIYAV